jgi:hypothetical protein
MPDNQDGAASTPPAGVVAAGTARGHEDHCFVVMPYGRTTAEIRWFKGWYDVVIKPTLISLGYEPKLSSAEEQPNAINDEIRAHLAFDPMVVVDLAGILPESDPNPNVMYELGIRHALGLPLVMMAWKGQRLPFDVGNQRVIMETRELLDLEANRSKLATFIRAAAAGNYYRPMEAVGRLAAIDAVSVALGEDSVLGVLVREIRDLRQTIVSRPRQPFRTSAPTFKRLLRQKAFRKELYPHFIESGGTSKQWGQLLKSQATAEIIEQADEWTVDNWKDFLADQARQWLEMLPVVSVSEPPAAAAPASESQPDSAAAIDEANGGAQPSSDSRSNGT